MVLVKGSNYVDVETRAILGAVHQKSMMDVHNPIDREELAAIRRYGRERKEAFMSGQIQAPQWLTPYIQRELRDPLLQFRWSFEHHCYVVDRWISDWNCWALVLYWRDTDGQAYNVGPFDMQAAVDMLNAGNMQQPDWLRAKYSDRARIQLANKKKGDDMLLKAVDSLSTRQIDEFVDIHRAIHTGETIVLHGESEKQMERMYETSKKSPAVPTNRALNPGMNPKHYKRKPR